MANKTLGNYQIMITSKYFECVDDFINLEIAVKRFQGNMERFHFNPIPLDKETRKFFPNLETYVLYSKNDEVFCDGRICKQEVQLELSFRDYLIQKDLGKNYQSFYYCKTDVSLFGFSIPLGVKRIENECFCSNHIIQSITIPSSVTSIGNKSFFYCTNLTFISLSGDTKKIGDGCFRNCVQLQNILLPTSILSIGSDCFCECHSLTSIVIPNSCFEIGSGCFYGCYSLKSICLPTSLTVLNDHLLCGCTSLNSFNIGEKVRSIGEYCFERCVSLIELKLPNSVTSLQKGCFSNCTSLRCIDLPTSIEIYGDLCFSRCEKLKKNMTIPNKCFFLEGESHKKE